MESMNFINPQTFSNAFEFIKFVDSMMHAYNYYIYPQKEILQCLARWSASVIKLSGCTHTEGHTKGQKKARFQLHSKNFGLKQLHTTC